MEGEAIVFYHDDVIKWNQFPRYCPFVWIIHKSPANSSHKGQWRAALMFSVIYAWKNVWVNNQDAGDMRRRRARYGITVMPPISTDIRDIQNHALQEISMGR